ncbi:MULTISPECIES: hypothetical protein [unclassified Knoellia]|uniref:immunity protein Imm33 domain-containing protein n=1 Tax=Knoellia altitudinis TaxID=3404795 RepID=UPI00360F4A3D
MADGIVGAWQRLISGDVDWPLHALRHLPSGQTTGWYFWTGELLSDDSFFRPWHTRHLVDLIPGLEPHLALEPGTRLIYAPDHLDVWHDSSLLVE